MRSFLRVLRVFPAWLGVTLFFLVVVVLSELIYQVMSHYFPSLQQ